MGTFKTVFEPGIVEPGVDNFECPLREVIKEFEKQNVGIYVFEVGCVEPGIDNVDTPLRKIIRELNKV